MADLVVHYLDLVDALKPGRKPHHMGFSMGGWMAAELAAVAREKFDRIVSVAPAGIAHPDHPPADLSAIAPQVSLPYLAHDASVALRYFPDPRVERSSQTFASARQREIAAVGRSSPHWASDTPTCCAGCRASPIRHWSSGAHDRLVPVQVAALWVEALPDTRLHLVPDAGHNEPDMKIGRNLAAPSIE